jgi:hypothetical protein
MVEKSMTFRLLPQLDRETAPTPDQVGADWTDHGTGSATLAKYSAALIVPITDQPPERLKSVPSPWARLLLFEQALFTTRHPSHAPVLAEWRGLLGCLALSDYLRINVAGTPVDLTGAVGSMGSLRQMAPADDATLLWDRLALIRVNGQLIGGTSPRTIVFTGIRAGVPDAVPFQAGRRLVDPTRHFGERKDRESLALLGEWIDQVISTIQNVGASADRFLGQQPAPRGTQPVSRRARLMQLLTEWKIENGAALDALGGSPFTNAIKFAETSILASAFPDSHPATDVLRHLRSASSPEEISRRSGLRVRNGNRIVDPGAKGVLMRDGHPFTGRVPLPAGQSADVDKGRFVRALGAAQLGDASAPDLGSFFEPRLVKVVQANPACTITLGSNDEQYLLPFRPAVLEHLQAGFLNEHLELSGDAGAGIKVVLSIPVQDGLSVRYEHVYDTRDIVQDAYTPELAVWPEFRSREWKHYFYVVRHTARQNHITFEPVEIPVADKAGSPDGLLQWGVTSRPVEAWQGLTPDGAGGLLLVTSSAEVIPDGTHWDLAIDFGSTHTRVFRSSTGVAGGLMASPVPLEPRGRHLLNRTGDLASQFFAAQGDDAGNVEEPRSLVRVPDATSRGAGKKTWLPSDGVIFWPAITHADSSTSGLRANLKWQDSSNSDLPAFHSYISQLYLSAAAEAAAVGATVRSVKTAYPSVFPNHLRWSHQREWDLLKGYGVDVKPAQSESDAVAAYLVERGGNMATPLLAVDVGGSTSDLAIWANNRRAAGDSIRLAGDLVSRLITRSASARGAVGKAATHLPISADPLPWKADNDSANALVFNDLLRFVARKRGSTLDLAKNLYEGPGSEGERIIAHAGYLFATASYLLGLMARRDAPGLDRYEIHFAGHGSEFLRWLDVLKTGAATGLPEMFFRAGLRADDSVMVDVHLPDEHAKQEVGRGLLAPPITGQQEEHDRTTFMGETGFSNEAGSLDVDAPLTLSVLKSITAPRQPLPLEEFAELQHFLSVFSKHEVTKAIANALGIRPENINRQLRDHIHNRIFGPQSTWQQNQQPGTGGDTSLIEPFFIIEAKALLEHTTENVGLFSA